MVLSLGLELVIALLYSIGKTVQGLVRFLYVSPISLVTVIAKAVQNRD